MERKRLLGTVALIISIAMLLTSCGKGPVIKELKKINDNDARYWAEFVKKNGINAIDSDNETVLLYAVQNNNTKLIKACIKCGADVNLNTQWPSLLAYPALYKNEEIVNLFLKKGAVIIPEKYNSFNDVIRQILASYDNNIPFDSDAEKIHELLFKKLSAEDFERYDRKSYFDLLDNDSNRQKIAAFYDVYKRMIKKGWKVKESDAYYVLRFIPKEEKFNFVKENRNLFTFGWILNQFVRWEFSQEDNEYAYNNFKMVLDLIDDANVDYSNIDDTFSRMIVFDKQSYDQGLKNLLDKTKDLVTILKSKNFDISNSKVILNDYRFIEKIDGIKTCEYWKEYYAKEDPNFSSSYEESIRKSVETIKKEGYFETLKFLVNEGFPMDEGMKEAYTYFLENYYTEK